MEQAKFNYEKHSLHRLRNCQKMKTLQAGCFSPVERGQTNNSHLFMRITSITLTVLLSAYVFEWILFYRDRYEPEHVSLCALLDFSVKLMYKSSFFWSRVEVS